MSGRGDERPPAPEPLRAAVVDAHTHLDACGAENAADVAAIMNRAEAVGVAAAVTVADGLASARWVVDAAGWDPRVSAAVAVHPTRSAGFGAEQRAEIETLAAAPEVVAVGETGLDYYWPRHDPSCPPPPVQQEAFAWHVALAKRLGKPLMIHDREAHDDVLALLDSAGAPETVIMHCFSGDAEHARRCAAAGYLMSFAGPVSFRNARELHQAARLVPDRLLLAETDAPYLTPHPYRGRPNEPYLLPWTVRALARLRGAAEEPLAALLAANAQRVFGRPEGPRRSA